jgi:hypothetical protein
VTTLFSEIRRRAAALVQRRARTVVLAGFVVLAVVETWPLGAHPARLSRNDNADTMANEWTLAWFAHQAPRAPLHLFDGNIFYPERNTLAYSETMIAESAMAAPLLWLGASPVLAYNLVLIAGFALSGWTMAIVIARWVGNWTAGILSGILFAFNAHTLSRLPHLQAQHPEFLPLVLMAFDALLREPRTGNAIRLTIWFVLDALTSVHLLVFTAIALIVGVLIRPHDWVGRRLKAFVMAVMLAAALAAALLLPVLVPYWQLHRQYQFVRSLKDVGQYAASYRDYLTTPARLHYTWWSRRFYATSALFPGALALVLTVFGIACGTLRDPRARMCLAFGVVGVYLSFGPDAPGYAALYGVFSALGVIRDVSRFGYLGIVAAAMLAGWGVVELRRSVSDRVWRGLVPALVVVATVEPLCAPIGYLQFDGIPSIYAQLRGKTSVLVAEFPFPDGGLSASANATYMLGSTLHWEPMLNGFAGFIPATYHENWALLRGFPDDRSVARLRALGVTHLFVHTDQMRPDTLEIIERTPGFVRLASEGPIALVRVYPQ